MKPVPWGRLRGAAVAALALALVCAYVYEVAPVLHAHGMSPAFGTRAVSIAKAALAFAALTLSLVDSALSRTRSPRGRRIVRRVGVALGVLAVAGYFDFGALNDWRFYHHWDSFHYYVGAKYAPELGYTHLYDCTAVAESELSELDARAVRSRRLRNLETDVLVNASEVLAHPEVCKGRFSPSRWVAFRADVRAFRRGCALEEWERIQRDHGYNPPPVWTAAGRLLTAVGPASTTTLRLLSSLDLLLFTVMFSAVGWAFGARVLLMSLVFWGTALPTNGSYTTGAFLRQDWLCLLVLAACLARKRAWAAAGGALAYSALLRVFPILFAVGCAAVVVSFRVRNGRFARGHVRLLAGAALAAGLLLGASTAVTGLESYRAFAAHIRVHNGVPLANHMGLQTVLSFSPEGRVVRAIEPAALDPYDSWKKLRAQRFDERRPLYYAIVVAISTALLLAASRVRTMWIAIALGAPLVMCLVQLTCYYLSYFLVMAPLARVSRRFEQAYLALGCASATLASVPALTRHGDDHYTAQSVLFVGFAVAVLTAFAATTRLSWQRARAVRAA